MLWPLGPGRKFETALADVTQSLWSACDIHVSSNETAAGRGGAEGRVGRRACRESGPKGMIGRGQECEK